MSSRAACRVRRRCSSLRTAASSSASREAGSASSRTACFSRLPSRPSVSDSSGERGLLGVAFDPAFLTTPYVYVYYTAYTPTVHNRISRFTANGDVAVPGSEVVILELDRLYASNHNGGALAFGPDGKLYAAVGENGVGPDAQLMTNLMGKMLRLNKDGSIPADNPFYSSTTRQPPRDLGVRPAQPVHVRVQPRRRRDVHQRRGAEHLGGNQRRRRRRQLRLAHDGGTDHAVRRSRVHVQSLQPRGVRDHWRRVLLSARPSGFHPTTSTITSSPTIAPAGFGSSIPPPATPS